MQSEKDLIEQKERYESIFNATSDSIIIYDENGFIVEANPAACKIFGYNYEELIGLHVSELYKTPEDFNILKEIAFSGKEYSGTHTRLKKDGSLIEVEYVGTRFIFDGKPHVLSAAKDITHQKKMEESLNKAQELLMKKEKKILATLENKVKERTAELEKINYELLQFTSVASHDLKEPIRKISIYGKMLKDRIGETIDTSSLKYLDNIVRSSHRMSVLIDDLLSFSRLSQEKPQFEKVDLNILVHQTLEDLELYIYEKDAVISIDKLPVIDGIPLQLGQVFQNLIGNSLKFAHPDKRPEITLRCEEFTEDGSKYYTLTFNDNGIGFHAEFADKIFEVFQRLHSRAEYEGTGVGLAIVKKIITLHKGHIIASGKKNEGAEFCIILPEKQPG